MSIESIIGFIVIALLSSLFKDKGKQQPKSRMTPTLPPKGDRQEEPVATPKRVNRNRNLLEEVLQEFQRDPGRFSGERRRDLSHPPKKSSTTGGKQPQAMETPQYESPYGEPESFNVETFETFEDYETSEVSEPTEISEKPNPQESALPSAKKQRAIPINLSRQSIVNAIILSEVLGKPKALKHQRH